MKATVYCRFNFITNFAPNLTEEFFLHNYFSFFKKKKTKILCKNLVIFILSLRDIIYSKDSDFNNWDLKLFILPTNKSLFTLLRAPYRYKLAKNQLMFKRYNFLISAKRDLIPGNAKDISSVNLLLNDLVTKMGLMETNIAFQRSSNVKIPVKLNNFFNYNL